MKKKICVLLSVLAMLINQTVFAAWGDDKTLLDPFNNELFDVVSEFEYPYELSWFMDFYNLIFVSNQDSSRFKIVEVIVDYSGNVTTNDLCDFVTYDEANEIYYDRFWGDVLVTEDEEGEQYNDGLVEFFNKVDEYYYENGFKDVSGNVVFSVPAISYYGCSYNLGLLCENENNGADGMPDMEMAYLTDFTTIMTDNKVYSFDENINCFNDDGYSIMQDNEGKYYVIKLKKGIIPTVSYNGEKIKFDQIPVIEEGRTLVPLRAIFNAIGADVSWDDATKTITAVKDDTTISLTIDNKTAYKNAEEITLDVPAKIINSRTMVPVRFIADCFDVNVDWDDTLKRVILTTQQ